ncbi:MAG TPA: hypothetical protein VH985_13915 [Candidatus Binatia bacterium]|jgi:hypothetical protein
MPKVDKSRLQAPFTVSPESKGARPKSGTRRTEGSEAMQRLEGSAAGLDFDAQPALTALVRPIGRALRFGPRIRGSPEL